MEVVQPPLDRKELKQRVRAIVTPDADLDTLTSRAVRQQLEGIYGFSLKPHKPEIEAAVLKALERVQRMREEEEEEEDANPQVQQATKKRKSHDEPEKGSKKVSKKPAAAAEPAPKKEAASRKMSAKEEAEEARLRKLINQCGLQAKTRFKGVRELSPAALLEKLGAILVDAFGSTAPSRQEMTEYKAKVELAKELDGIDVSNILPSKKGAADDADEARRPRRLAARQRPSSYSEWDNVDKDGELLFAVASDKEEEDDELEEEDEEETQRTSAASSSREMREEKGGSASTKPKARRVVVDEEEDDDSEPEA